MVLHQLVALEYVCQAGNTPEVVSVLAIGALPEMAPRVEAPFEVEVAGLWVGVLAPTLHSL